LTAQAPQSLSTMRRSLEGDGEPGLPRVRLVADIVCPWCWIGFTRLERLAAERPFELIWQPFLLNPYLPPEGVPRALYLERKFGTRAGVETAQRRVAAAAAGDGLAFDLTAITRQPSSRAAHALLLAAAEAGCLWPMAGALFRAYFRDGQDIGSVDTLGRLAATVGLPAQALAASRGSAHVQAVSRGHEDACRAGVAGVPVVVFGADHLIAGAQPIEALRHLLDLERFRAARA
jgi:predicted DsbA family dithiol-disulfide isomerase